MTSMTMEEAEKQYADQIVKRLFYSDQFNKAIAVDLDVGPERAQLILDHIERIWSGLGEDEPHWSVVVADDFLSKNLAENIDKFYQSGRTELSGMDCLLERNGVVLRPDGVCLEYGCGVGRVTRWLSERFEQVVGADVSAGHLSLMKKYCDGQGITNVTPYRIRGIADIAAIGDVDFFYSKIVLQHNPPPLAAAVLSSVLKLIKPGGVGVFQIPTYAKGYSFDVEEYLSSMGAIERMEMHVVPQRSVFRVLAEQDFEVLEVFRDHLVASLDFISNTFLVRKRE